LLGAFTLAACAVNQSIFIADNGSGKFVMHAEVSTLLRDYLMSLSDLSGNPGTKEGRLFDSTTIRKDFQSRPGIVVRHISTPTPNVLDMEIDFDTLENLLGGQDEVKDTGAVALVDSGDKSTLRLHLDRVTWNQLARVFPQLQDPLFAELGPQNNEQVTDDDYLDMVRFSIGDAAPGLLKRSFITLTIKPQGEILSQSGGTLIDGAVVFRIPLLRILVLNKALDYSISFQHGGQNKG
jgi:hypothetical protein